MPVSDIYLVSNQITPVPPSEVDGLERAIGSLPAGYREFVALCGGQGKLWDSLQVWPQRKSLTKPPTSGRTTLTFSSRPSIKSAR